MYVAAGIVLTARNMATKRRRSAMLDCAHHLHLVETDVPMVGSTPRGTVVAEDVRHLQSWTGHAGDALRLGLSLLALASFGCSIAQQIDRALNG